MTSYCKNCGGHGCLQCSPAVQETPNSRDEIRKIEQEMEVSANNNVYTPFKVNEQFTPQAKPSAREWLNQRKTLMQHLQKTFGNCSAIADSGECGQCQQNLEAVLEAYARSYSQEAGVCVGRWRTGPVVTNPVDIQTAEVQRLIEAAERIRVTFPFTSEILNDDMRELVAALAPFEKHMGGTK